MRIWDDCGSGSKEVDGWVAAGGSKMGTRAALYAVKAGHVKKYSSMSIIIIMTTV